MTFIRKKSLDLHDFFVAAQKEGFCVLHSGEGGLENEKRTMIGISPSRMLKSRIPEARGHWMGYLAYPNPTLKNDIPASIFYEYDSLLFSEKATCGPLISSKKKSSGKWSTSVTRAQYIRKIEAIKELLAAGEIYQMCYCLRFQKPFSGDPYELFLRLAQNNPTDFSAYLNCGDFQIVSASPERFFKIEKGIITTQPIKGTAPRKIVRGAPIPASMDINLKTLLHSEKEKAELDMITDLERNDVGKICKYGTLKLTKERATLPMKNIWHTYSEVQGKLTPNLSPADILGAMFPGGSITGCPKKRAMHHIEILEGLPRNIFTGSIGYITPHGMDFNIAIRTALIKNGMIEFWVGGGIVADSDPQREYDECLLKAERFMAQI